MSQPWFEKRVCSGNTAIVAQRRPVGGLCTDTLATALPDPRRADVRRSWECAFLNRTNRFFADKRSQLNTRAGGVSPPWDVLGMRTRNAEIQRVAVAIVVCDQRQADAGL